MPAYVALLRGINVGGSNKVAMADLRRVVAGLGHTDVATYIQSGNVVFTTPRTGPSALADELEHAIADALGVRPRVLVLSRDGLARVVRDNPYADEPNPKYVHAVFLPEDPGPGMADEVAAAEQRAAAKGSRDDARLLGATLYLHTPDGLGRSELAAQLSRRGGPMSVGTARNWATVAKLLALCDAAAGPDAPGVGSRA